MVRFLMVQGTSSNSGKSTLTAALCRIFSDKGYRVAPLKAQNMSSNVHITADGLEMARAQALQAVAARTEPSVYMNPILLKPMGDYVSKVVLLGREYREMHAKDYYNGFVMRDGARYVAQAIRKLSEDYDLIVIEGAGSPAEINLARYDLANMKLAEKIRAPVVIVADIERGGCFASMVGTLQLLERKHKTLVKGFVINKFRGDKSILHPAVSRFEKMTGKPVLGIIPFIDEMLLPSEDSLGMGRGAARPDRINMAIIRYPGAANLSDLDPLLQASAATNAYHVTPSNRLDEADIILLPPSRDIARDLEWLHESGTAERIRALHAAGTPVIGIGDGYAMMCKRIFTGSRRLDGLGLLDVVAHSADRLSGRIRAEISKASHLGAGVIQGHLRQDYRLVRGRGAAPLLDVTGLNGRGKKFAEGSAGRDGLALGSCVYGLFDAPAIRNTILGLVAQRKGLKASAHDLGAMEFWDIQTQRLSEIVRANIDMQRLMALAGLH